MTHVNDNKEIMKEFFDERAATWDTKATRNFSLIENMLLKGGIKEGDDVLDVACGTGVITGLLSKLSNHDVLGIDLSTEMIKVANEKYKDNDRVNFVAGDFLTFKSNEKDVVVIFNAFPHFMDLEALKNTLSNNLKKGGRFIICSDLSLERVKMHHKFCMHVSREVVSLKEDFKLFNDLFDVTINEDDENHYLVVGIKK